MRLEVSGCGLGGLGEGCPTGWGLMLCEKARAWVRCCRFEYAHQVRACVQRDAGREDVVMARVRPSGICPGSP